MSYATEQTKLASAIARIAFAGKKRKWGGRNAIEHMRDIIDIAQQHGCNELMLAVIWLHDVIEDTPVTAAMLLDCGIDKDIVDHVVELTNVKLPGISRQEQKEADRERIKEISELSKKIKLMDRLANLRELSDAPISFVQQYLPETERLLAVLPDTSVKTEIQQQIQHLKADLGKRLNVGVYLS